MKMKRKTKSCVESETKTMETMESHSILLPPNKAESTYLAVQVKKKKKKKKKKSKTQRSDGLQMKVLDDKSIVFVPTQSEATNSGDKKKKSKSQISDDLEMKILDDKSIVFVPTESEATNSEEKKKKRKAKKTNDVEMAPLNYESPSLVPTEAKKRKKHKAKRSDGLEMETADSEPSDNFCAEKKRRKKKWKRKDDLGMTIMDSESTLLGISASEGHDYGAKNMETQISESLVDGSLVSQKLAPTSRKKRKKISETQINDLDHEKQNRAIERIVPLESAVNTDERAPETPIESVDLGCSEKKKRKKRKKKKMKKIDKLVEVDGAHESNDKVCEVDNESTEAEPVVENTSSQVDGVLRNVVDILAEKVSVINCSDIEPKGVLYLDAISKEQNLPQVTEALPERSLVSRSNKKLLILDVNGILVDFVSHNPRPYIPDLTISKKYVFKRPYCDEFLGFCFERFNIGVWSSRMKQNMEKAINFLFQDSKEKLFLCWDQSHCTSTDFNTLENQSKPLVLKELRKVWEKSEPDLPFEKGEYDETNTLLLDDSPYKALRNPANTAIFPTSYRYTDWDDNALGPGGALRSYLERLSLVNNVQKYVEQNPFGQAAITESHKSWSFYSKIVNTNKKSSKL